MTLAELRVLITGDNSKLDRSIEDSKKKTIEAGKELGASMMKIGGTLSIALTAPLVAFGKKAFDSSAEFGKSMATVQVASQATAAQMEQIRKAAIGIGYDLRLPGATAIQAAQAMEELVKAGLSVDQTLQATRGTLMLSSAAQVSVAKASEIAANALNAFALKASDMTMVTDVLAGAANQSSASMQQIAEGLQQSAAVYANAGISFQTLSTYLAQMANAGIKGSDAGTSLKTMLMALQAPSSAAQKSIAQLGISIYDSAGKMRELPTVMADLESKLKPLSQQQRDLALATIFGSDAMRAASIIVGQGAAKYDELSAKIEKAGQAQMLAQAQAAGLAGVQMVLSKAFEAVSLQVGETMVPVIMRLAETAVPVILRMIQAFGELPAPVQEAALGFGVFLAALGPVIVAIGAVVSAVSAIGAPLLLVASGIAALGVAFTTNAGGIRDVTISALAPVQESFQKLVEAMKKTGVTGDSIRTSITTALHALGQAAKPIIETIMGAFANLIDWFTATLPDIQKAMQSLIGNIQGFWQAHGERIMSIIKPIWDAVKSLIGGAMELIGGIIRTVLKLIQGDWNGAWNEITGAVGRAVSAIVNTLGSLVTAIDNIFKLIGDWLVQAGKSLWIKMKEVGRQILDGLIAGLRGMYSKAKETIKWVTDGITNAAKKVLRIQSPSKVFAEIGTEVVNGLIVGLVQMGPAGVAAAKNLAENVIKPMTEAAQRSLESFRAMREGIYQTWREMNALNPIDLMKIQFPGVPAEEIRKLDLFTQKIAEWNRQKENAKSILREMLAGTGDSILSPSQMRSIAILANPVLAMIPKIKEMATAFNDERNKRFRDTMRDIALQVQILGTNSQDAKLKIKLLSEGMTEAQAMAVVQAERQRTEMERYQEMLKGIVNTATSGIQESLDQLLRGRLPSALKAIRNMFSQVFAQIAQDFIRSQLNTIVLNALSGVRTGGRSGGGFLGGLGGVSGAMSSLAGMAAIAGSAASGAWSGGASLAAFADGGYMRPGQLSIVGERGPEIMVSGRGGTVIPNEALGGQTINVHITVYANDAASFAKTKEQIASEVGAAISKAAARGS